MNPPYLPNADSTYVEALYESYKKDPSNLEEGWRRFFEGYDFARSYEGDQEQAILSDKEVAVRDMIHAYRARAHLLSDTNPVRPRRDRKPLLSLSDFGLSETDLSTPFKSGTLLGTQDRKPLKEIINALKKTYTGQIGFEYMHIRNPDIIEWFKHKCEQEFPRFQPTREEKERILTKLNEATVFENFLHTKYLGQKRFSLEGGEATIPALDVVMRKGVEMGLEEVVIGMAHRGRLNVLGNIMGKSYEQIFKEFEGSVDRSRAVGDGDVKYHMGYSTYTEVSKDRKLRLKLFPNPSHLEAVDPVILGSVRAKIDRQYEKDPKRILPVLIHGDAAIAGQGILYELIQMGHLPAYDTGGTFHFVINNQLGFTTDFDEARSSIYCTDLAKVVDSPVLHVNGDDPESVVFCVELALEFRQKFGKDVFIDMVCYRKYGHNEADEPRFTQPDLYQRIAKHESPREVYLKKLIARDEADAHLAKEMDSSFRLLLAEKMKIARTKESHGEGLSTMEEEWRNMRTSTPEDFERPLKSTLSEEHLNKITKALCHLPPKFQALKQIVKLIEQRQKAFESQKINWPLAELMAYASLLLEGKMVRLVGQDSERGTFSHRHAVIQDEKTFEPYSQLSHLDKKQGDFHIYNSLLSEYAALGFEYGYSVSSPHALVLWEAQFGDFANGAQVMIDQFISTAYTKWHRMSGLVLLLPHGFEGQGPEHSSARLERFLQLCAGRNMFVYYPTSPANFFHLLRRQLLLPFRMPAVVLSPKSLFRHPQVISPLQEIRKGGFQELIPDDLNPKAIQRVLLCSGKVYYDLWEAREKQKRKDVAILRLEQLYPFPQKAIAAEIKKYKNASWIWVQEEPENMGARDYICRVFKGHNFSVVSRKEAASPATGHYKAHTQEQEELIKKALG
ncbi:MAG: 2-oxoglutarate dehydrogenase E1 component [Cytophagales bacterium]|nr:2-oxoglutarate dehydrogenase E1 component [Cytophagales bacterium]